MAKSRPYTKDNCNKIFRTATFVTAAIKKNKVSTFTDTQVLAGSNWNLVQMNHFWWFRVKQLFTRSTLHWILIIVEYKSIETSL